jgi:hypothetical protein
MATYAPQSLGIKPPPSGFQEGGWYNGRQYIGGTLSEPGQIHPGSSQVGAGQLVSPEVNAASAAQQGQTAQQLEAYLQKQRQQQAKLQPTPAMPTPTGGAGAMATTASMAGAGGGMGTGLPQQQAAINLPEVYKSLYEGSGITEKEQALANSEKMFLEAKGKISDNPFTSAAQIDQRLQRLQRKYEEETAPIRSEIAQKKADIETQLQLQTKQFDINSQSARDALTYFNTLLDAGALNSASGEDIAAITRTTGIPSSAIQSAIKAKTATKADTEIVKSEADDGTVTISTIDKNTGEVINQQSLGRIGNAQTGGTKATAAEVKQSVVSETSNYLAQNSNSYGHVDKNTYLTARRALVAEAGITPAEFDALFADYRDPYNTDQYQITQ